MDKLVIKKVESKLDLNYAIKIRKTVFVKEQSVPKELEIDGLDGEADHFLAFLGDKPIGCARIRTRNCNAKLERIAILKPYRCKGHGREITQYLIDYCKEKMYHSIYLHSQSSVSDFYKKLGFNPVGKKFFEAGIEHIKMVFKQCKY